MNNQSLISVVKKHWWVLFVIIFALMGMFGIWSVEYLGFQDHPSHLLRTHIALNYTNPAYGYDKYFLLNWGLTPNQGSDAIMFLLGHIVSVATAAKLFFCLYIILFPLSVWYFLRRVRPENCAYTLLASALAFNQFVLAGNENFLISIPVFFFFLGYWYGERDNFNFRTQLVSSLLLLLLYYCHMLSFVCALLVMITVSLLEKRRARDILRAASLALPGLFLFFAWVVRIVTHGATEETGLMLLQRFPSWGKKIRALIDGLVPFNAYFNGSEFLGYVFLLALLFMIGFSIWQLSGKQRDRIWPWTIVILFIFAISLPRFLIIFDPGQRVAYLTLLTAGAIFSSKKIPRLCFLGFLIIFTFVAHIQAIKYLATTSKLIFHAVAPFKEVPYEISNRQKKMLPLVLYPYTYYPFYHRAFEYYNIFNGGVNPHGHISWRLTVRYRAQLPAPDIYKPFPEKITDKMLEAYDIIIVIGKDGYRAKELLDFLSSAGFKQVSGNDVTVVLGKV